MWVRMLVLVSVGTVTRAQQDPEALLALVSQHVMDSVDRLPEYATVTIERKTFEPHRHLHSCDDVAAAQKSSHWKVRLATSDTVRADVANGIPKTICTRGWEETTTCQPFEVYSWLTIGTPGN
jgi:hypothetical protein